MVHVTLRTRRRPIRLEALRLLALERLGGKCASCGEADHDVLEIDHINPIHGQLQRHNSNEIYYQLIDGSNENLQLLCANCHRRKTRREMRAEDKSGAIWQSVKAKKTYICLSCKRPIARSITYHRKYSDRSIKKHIHCRGIGL